LTTESAILVLGLPRGTESFPYAVAPVAPLTIEETVASLFATFATGLIFLGPGGTHALVQAGCPLTPRTVGRALAIALATEPAVLFVDATGHALCRPGDALEILARFSRKAGAALGSATIGAALLAVAIGLTLALAIDARSEAVLLLAPLQTVVVIMVATLYPTRGGTVGFALNGTLIYTTTLALVVHALSPFFASAATSCAPSLPT